MVNASPSSYDEVLYPGNPYFETHPNRLASLAALFGMLPAPVECCRALELGCGDAGNLIPMAIDLPKSEFVGIDIAARPIANGRETVSELRLDNIDLRQFDIMDVSSEFGKFDYIIAHGVYSWVPAVVRDKLFEICRTLLSDQGVAFLSYNTYPGWRMREMAREIMRFHVREIIEPQQQVSEALGLIKILAESQSEAASYGIILKEELKHLLSYSESKIFHDDLAEINFPVYFFQFIEHASQYGLQYLAEAEYSQMQDFIYPPHVRDMLRSKASNLIAKEQYLDFLKCRRFRQTLLCRQEVELDRSLLPERIKLFQASSQIRPISPASDILSKNVEKFAGPKGAVLSTDHPLSKSALLLLGEIWPQALQFNELLSKARSRIDADSPKAAMEFDEDAQTLGGILLEAYAAGLVDLHVYTPRFTLNICERPVACPLARLQARSSPVVTSLRHTNVKLDDELGRILLPLLDGSRDRAAILKELNESISGGVLKISAEQLDQYLLLLARHALMIA